MFYLVNTTLGPQTFFMVTASGVYALTGRQANLMVSRRMIASVGSFSVGGQNVELYKSGAFNANQGQYDLTGLASILKRGLRLVSDLGAYGVTGQLASLIRQLRLDCVSGALAVTGLDAGLLATRKMLADGASYEYFGVDAQMRKGFTLVAEGYAATLDGQNATLFYDGVPSTIPIAADAGSYVLTGVDAALLYAVFLTGDAGAVVVTGQDAGLRVQRLSAVGTYRLYGKTAQRVPSVPTFVAISALANGTGTVAVSVPGSRASGDLLLIFASVCSDISASPPSGWFYLPGSYSPGNGGTSATVDGLMVFYKESDGTETTATLPDSGDHTSGCCMIIRGQAPNWMDQIVVSNGASSTSQTCPSVTTLTGNTLVVVAAVSAIATTTSATTNAGLGSLTERIDTSTTTGNDNGMMVATGSMVTAGSTGTTALTYGSATQCAALTFNIIPKSGPVSAPWVKFNFTDNRTHASVIQLSEINFKQKNSKQNVSAGTATNPNGTFGSGEGPDRAFNNNNNDKWCMTDFQTDGYVADLIINLASGICFDSYSYHTGNDEPGRDPKTWTVQISRDGTNWTTVATVADGSTPTSQGRNVESPDFDVYNGL